MICLKRRKTDEIQENIFHAGKHAKAAVLAVMTSTSQLSQSHVNKAKENSNTGRVE